MSDSPNNKNNGLDPEDIKDIERIIEQRSKSSGIKQERGTTPPKRYLRNPQKPVLDSTTVINKIKDDRELDVKPVAPKADPQDKPAKKASTEEKKPETEAQPKNPDATITVPVVRE